MGYATFECIHVLSSLIRKLLVAYLTLLGLYGLLNFYTIGWILHRSVHSYTGIMYGDVGAVTIPKTCILIKKTDQYNYIKGGVSNY